MVIVLGVSGRIMGIGQKYPCSPQRWRLGGIARPFEISSCSSLLSRLEIGINIKFDIKKPSSLLT